MPASIRMLPQRCSFCPKLTEQRSLFLLGATQTALRSDTGMSHFLTLWRKSYFPDNLVMVIDWTEQYLWDRATVGCTDYDDGSLCSCAAVCTVIRLFPVMRLVYDMNAHAMSKYNVRLVPHMHPRMYPEPGGVCTPPSVLCVPSTKPCSPPCSSISYYRCRLIFRMTAIPEGGVVVSPLLPVSDELDVVRSP